MKERIKNICIMLALSVLLLLPAYTGTSYAQAVPVVQDNGSGNRYDALPVNYVQITDLNFSRAVIESGSGYSIQNGYLGAQNSYAAILMWTGKVHFGSSNATNDQDASLRQNALPDVTLRFKGGARLSDGTACDIKLTLSEIRVNLGASKTDKITDNTTVQVPVASGWGWLAASPPRTTHAVAGATAEKGNNAACNTANRYKVTMQIVNAGTNTPVSSAYPTMLVEFKDLDILDKTMKKSAAAAARGNGYYCEGVEMVSGWVGSAVIGPTTSDLANTVLVNAQTTSGGNTKIKADGAKITEFVTKFNPPASDYETLWSGFVAAVQPQSFSFYWTGSIAVPVDGSNSMGTGIGGQPTVAVKAKRIDPGAAGAYLGGAGTYSGQNTWYTNTHLMNSTADYNYRPAEGWTVKSLKVDGVAQTLSEEQKAKGGTYTFARLNKYPLPARDIRTGQVLAAQSSGFYTIETEYERLPRYEATKISDTENLRSYEDKEITYQIRCDELYDDVSAGKVNITDDLAGGLLTLTGDPVVKAVGGTYTVNKADDTGLDYTFESQAAKNTRPYLLITYKAKVKWSAYFASDAMKIINVCHSDDPDDPDDSTEIKVLSSLKVTKTVSGRMRDTEKYFEFNMSLSGLQPETSYAVGSGNEFGTGGGAEIIRVTAGQVTGNGIRSDQDGNIDFRFKLKSGQGIGVLNIPVGAKYKVSESESDHRPSYTQESDKDSPVFVKKESGRSANSWTALSTEEETMDKEDGVITVAFDNNREPAPITGIFADHRWQMVLAALVTVVTAVLILAARHRSEAREAEENGE